MQDRVEAINTERCGLSDVEFEAFLWKDLQAHPLSKSYPALFAAAPRCIGQWRRRYRGNPSLWKRLFDKERVLKEFIESIPIIVAVESLLKGTAEDKQFTVVDLCCGKGYLSMFLSELLPPSRVKGFVLIDKAWPMHGTAPQAHHINWEHIYGKHDGVEYEHTWPIPLTTSKQDLKSGSQRRKLQERFLRNNGPVILVAVHLCGTLSLAAVHLFNDNPDVHLFALKPCCLPGIVHAKRHEIFDIGNHKFDAKLVCVNGKWKKNQWSGPRRSSLIPYFDSWTSNLSLGIKDVDKEQPQARKTHKIVHVQNDGGYQNDFLFVERIPTTPLLWENVLSSMADKISYSQE